MSFQMTAPELAFVAKLEGERDTWRTLKAGKDDRIEAILENNKESYRARNYGTSMPGTVAKEIRQHAEAEEAKKIAEAEASIGRSYLSAVE